MFIDSLKYSKENYVLKFKENFSTLSLLFIFSIFLDITRELIGATDETALIIHGLTETVGTCFFYALLLNKLLGIEKLTILNFFTYLRVNIIYSLFYLLGSVFLILPGLYILTFFFFAPIIALEGKESGSYFKKSKEMVKKSPMAVFGVGLILITLMGLEFWLMGPVKSSLETEITKYLFVIVSNIVTTSIEFYLFITSVFLYKALSLNSKKVI